MSSNIRDLDLIELEPLTQTDTALEWRPSSLVLVIWNVLGLALFVVFLGIYTNISSAEGTIVVELADVVIAIISLNALLVIHELTHGFVMSRFGGRPRYGLKMLGRVVPVAYCTSPGSRFTRAQFVVITITPFLLISLIGAVVVASLPGKSALPLALAIHAAGCIGDLWMTGVALSKPSGTVLEDRMDGVVFHLPEISRQTKTGAA